MKLRLLLIALLLGLCAPVWGADSYTRTGTHQANNTTWTPVSATCNAYLLYMNVSNAGTSWIITIKTRESTPRVLWSGTATVGNTSVLNNTIGLEMTSGMDVTFSGTAGVADFFFVYK